VKKGIKKEIKKLITTIIRDEPTTISKLMVLLNSESLQKY
jgi:hypothetical protein